MGTPSQCPDEPVGPARDLTSLCKNSKIAFWKSEKRVVGTLAVRKSASYPNLGGRFFDSIPRSGVFTQAGEVAGSPHPFRGNAARTTDRKSTRLNSSHRTISYAVF